MAALLESSSLFSMCFYLAIVLGLFVLGDWLDVVTRSKVSAMFILLISFMLLFMFGVIPKDIIERAGLTAAASFAMPMLIIHMGTMFNLRQLFNEWRAVATAALGMAAAMIGIFCISPIIGRDSAMVSIPIINGALVATNIMVEAAAEKGMVLAAALGPLVFSIQIFISTPLISHAGTKEGRRLLEEFRAAKVRGVTLRPELSAETGSGKPRFFEKHNKYYTSNTCIFITVLGGVIAVALGEITGISYSIIALVLSVAISTTGIIPERVLEKGKATGFISMVALASVIPSLANVSVGDIGKLLLQVVCVFAATIIASFLLVCVLPGWKLLGSKSLAFGVVMCQMSGFPVTYLISERIANSLGDTEEEKTYILEMISPKFVVAGLASVTVLSIIVAGIFATLL